MNNEVVVEDKKSYWIHKLMAVVLDVLVVVLFVFIGRNEHDGTYTIDDYVRISSLFLACFFATMLIISKDYRSVKSAFIASVISVPIAFFLRVAQTQHDLEIAFLIISFLFLTFGWVLWRFVLGKLRPQ